MGIEGTVQQLTTTNPTPIVLVVEVPNTDECLGYRFQLCLRRTLMILKSFLLSTIDTDLLVSQIFGLM